MEQELVQRVSTENFEKIKRMLHNITKVKVQIKSKARLLSVILQAVRVKN